LSNDAFVTSGTTIGLTWVAPTFDGGSPILDYRVWTNSGSGDNFNVLASGIT
jgi:hypothetical protein